MFKQKTPFFGLLMDRFAQITKRSKFKPSIAAVLITSMLIATGCGQKGPLYLPDAQMAAMG